MEAKDFLGWSASFILFATIVHQIYTQWRKGSAEGVSWFLFVGQFFASAAFLAYSILVDDLVFVATNLLLLISHIVGVLLTWKQKHQAI